jgi:hypothetical protein
MEWDPDRYLHAIREELPSFDVLLGVAVAATEGVEAQRVSAMEVQWDRQPADADSVTLADAEGEPGSA